MTKPVIFKQKDSVEGCVEVLRSEGDGPGIERIHHSFREVSFFTRGGLLKIGGQVLCLRSKGIKRFFQIKKGGSLIFFKEIKYFVKHSWNSC